MTTPETQAIIEALEEDIEEPSDEYIDAHRSDEAKARSAEQVAVAQLRELVQELRNEGHLADKREDRHAEAQRVGDAVHAAVLAQSVATPDNLIVRDVLASVAYTAAYRAVLDGDV